MSTAYSSAKQKYIGNGVTTEWGFDFPIQKHSELKVYLKRSGMPQVLLEEGVDYSFVTENTIAFPIKTGEAKLQAADVLAMQRESVFESEYNFSNQQRLEPEEVMHADDNLERQIQELKRDSESSIKVLPTSSVDPTTLVEHVERVYGSVDNIDTVANDKANVDKVAGSISNVNTVAGDIESVKTVENNIESVVIDATNISDIKTVAGSIANVNKTAGSIDNVNVVAPSISSVNTVATNISSVNTAASNMAAIQYAPTAADNAAQSAANAANSATISANSAIWAEGTDAQVQALGGVHSSKGWAEQSTSVNISLTNTPYTTNRILEIPQDIKLELNNGTLTLKAGSKVYVPNGAGTFNAVTIASDVSTQRQDSQDCIAWYNTDTGTIQLFPSILFYSGTTAPSGYPFMFWYDTTSNKCKVTSDSGSTWVEGQSFPICVVSTDGTKISAIKQVFNGIGYIGSTVFVLPGVKVQIPNGRNADGTCKSIKYTNSSVKKNQQVGNKNSVNLVLATSGIDGSKVYDYDEKTNYCFRNDTGAIYKDRIIIGKISVSSDRITSLKPFTVDSVVNSNEFYQLKDKAVTTDTTQTISGSKRFTQPAGGMSIDLVADTNQQTVPTTDVLREIGLYYNTTHTKGDGYTSWIRGYRGSNGATTSALLARRFLESDSQEILNYICAHILPDGTPIATTKTPPVGVTSDEIVTAGWFNSKMQVVSALPAAPNANVFYFIPD